ncbi:MAG: asparaginase [Deltaproteobacteria bacterium HGW-Deltaproteobacteria-14]|jgi:L-asparaginase II|nr:MAG: asparaginase [Deltaproteobacteria bacterium HGW-Deltaproteobacteria-14]
MNGTSTVFAYRGHHVETEHAASVAVVAPGGRALFAAGDPRRSTTLRSTAKPFQAQALFASGAFERFAVSTEELALACASHQATPRHVALAAGLLARIGLSVADLRCGAHDPGDERSRHAMALSGEEATALHNNCSGKHAGMLAAALSFEAPTESYLALDHPVQRVVQEVHRRLSGSPHLAWVIDGCSAPCAVMPLARLARMYAALADPEAAAPELARGLDAAFEAMRAHPELIAGDDVADTLLMRALPGVVAKRGADGAYALALRETAHGPLGVAIKVHDGSGEARTALVIAVLDALGVTTAPTAAALGPLRDAPRLNWRGLVVGRWEARLALAPA